MRERVRPRITPSATGRPRPMEVAVESSVGQSKRARVSASLPSKISRALMAAIYSKGGTHFPPENNGRVSGHLGQVSDRYGLKS